MAKKKKKRVRVRQHVNPLRLEHLQVPGLARIAVPDGADVEVELGCADARFLFERARVAPRAHLVGIEIREPLVRQCARKAHAAGLGARMTFVYANMNTDLDAVLAPRSVARFFLSFPDPWWKYRHWKRRVVNRELVEQLHRALAPGGELYFQSDVWDLALDAMAALEESDALFANRDGSWTFCRANPYGVRSRREWKCEEKGAPIWRLLYTAR